MSDKSQEFDQQIVIELKNQECQIDQEGQEISISIKQGLKRKNEHFNEVMNYKKAGQQFSIEEDRLILELVLNFGPKFQKIHKHFPGKTLAMVKNRYYKYLRYKWELLNPQDKVTEKGRQINTVCQFTCESYENLREKQQNLSALLHQERDALVNSIAERSYLPNAKILVEYLIANLF